MNTARQSLPPGVSEQEYSAYLEKERRRDDTKTSHSDGIDFSDLVSRLSDLPPESPSDRADRLRRLEESELDTRIQSFKRVCPAEFYQETRRSMLSNPVAFDLVASWDGLFPGPLCIGRTGTSKTRAAWASLRKLVVDQRKNLVWFPIRRLIGEISGFEDRYLQDEFWRKYRCCDVLMIDDLDKINWQFESEGAALFQFYDWIYREHRPCITTTNKGRQWWTERMGDAFARRLFDDAHQAIQF